MNTNVVSLPSDVSVCAGKSTTITAGGLTTYTWDTGSHFSSLIVTPASNTSYSVTGMDNFGCVLSGAVNVTVLQLPSVSASASSPMICRGESVTLTAVGADSYVWNNGETASSFDQVINIDLPHSFTVTGTGANGCSSTAVVQVTVSNCLGLQDQDDIQLSVFPNPTTGQIYIQGELAGVTAITVYDVTGKLVLQKRVVSADGNIDISHLEKGIYYITVKTAQGDRTQKIIKE